MTPRMGAGMPSAGAALTVSAVMLTACSDSSTQVPDATEAPIILGGAAAEIAADPHILPSTNVAEPPQMRVGDDVIPPTNRWFSGLAFGDEPQPVFPGPLSFVPTPTGFSLGVPQVNSTADTIAGPPSADAEVDLGTGDFLISDYTDATVTLAYSEEGEPVGELTLAAGAAAVSFRSSANHRMLIQASLESVGQDLWTFQAASGRDYLVWAQQAEVAENGSSTEIALTEGSEVNILAAPDDLDDIADLAEAAASPITGSTAGYDLSVQEVSTTLRYTTEGEGAPMLAVMPHQSSFECADEVGGFSTIYGQAQACLSDHLEWSAPRVANPTELSLSALGQDQRSELADQVRADTAEDAPYPADTYFGGKAMARDATLLMLAHQLELEEESSALIARLGTALSEWTEPEGCEERQERCFVYDPAVQGVVGLEASFGSEEFNDHHFHYGSFLYAAGVLDSIDDSYTDELVPVMNLLAANIASGYTTEDFPRLRAFDVYRGHSWASGFSPFADGNNQESVSEAVNAWAGLNLWAQAVEDEDLVAQSEWLISMEAHSARAYWTDFDAEDDVYSGYEHSIAALNWGGKRDYATWFSPEPSAMLGILILPLRPVGEYLAGDPERIRENVAVATDADGGYDVMFGDYLLMYEALAGPEDAQRALSLASELPDERIDDGNTRSYMMAWLMVQASDDAS